MQAQQEAQIKIGKVQVYDNHFRAAMTGLTMAQGKATLTDSDIRQIAETADRLAVAAIDKVRTFALAEGVSIE
jgi:putative protein kinase ArgK-like GTPase of G3E family